MPLLHQEPPARIDTLDVLLGIAMAMESESVRRYAQLAEAMDRRGEGTIAATFRGLMAEEEEHSRIIGRWAADLGHAVPEGTPFEWLLPPDIAASWEDLLDRTRLTPYRVLSLAVVNEQRAFAFYSHIAAATTDPAVRRHAEALAQEELNHAALLRRERRRAYHRGGGMEKPERIDTPAALEHLVRTLFAAAAAGHTALARRLAAAGDAEGAALLDAIASDETATAGSTPPAVPPDGGTADPWPAAIAVVEGLAERFADIAAAATDEAVLTRALALQESATRHLARLSDAHPVRR